jgi:hypothetical protein
VAYTPPWCPYPTPLRARIRTALVIAMSSLSVRWSVADVSIESMSRQFPTRLGPAAGRAPPVRRHRRPCRELTGSRCDPGPMSRVPNPQRGTRHVSRWPGNSGGRQAPVILAGLALHPGGGQAYSSAGNAGAFSDLDKIEEMPPRRVLGDVTGFKNLGNKSSQFHPRAVRRDAEPSGHTLDGFSDRRDGGPGSLPARRMHWSTLIRK